MTIDPTEADMEARTVRFGLSLISMMMCARARAGIPGEVFERFAPNRVFPMTFPGYTGRSAIGAACS